MTDNSRYTRRLNVSMTEEMYERLIEEAGAELTRADVVRLAVEQYFSRGDEHLRLIHRWLLQQSELLTWFLTFIVHAQVQRPSAIPAHSPDGHNGLNARDGAEDMLFALLNEGVNPFSDEPETTERLRQLLLRTYREHKERRQNNK
jgi:hypothetical protein